MATEPSQVDLLLKLKDFVLELSKIRSSLTRQCIQFHTSLILSEIDRLEEEREPQPQELILEIRYILMQLGSQSSLRSK